MSIRIVPARRVRKVKTKNGQEVLRRLEAYLESECDDPVEILCGFWKDQQDAQKHGNDRKNTKRDPGSKSGAGRRRKAGVWRGLAF